MIIGLTGLAGSGKSTAAEYLVRYHGFTRQGFAWPLKTMLRTLDPILGLYDGNVDNGYRLSELGNLAETEIKARFPEYRRLLQVLGTDCIRAVDPDFWVKAAMKDLDPGKNYVFDDVRFPNEAEAIKAAGGLLANIDRPGLVRGAHASEAHAGHMGEDCFVINSGTVEAFEHMVTELVAEAGAHA